MNDEKYNNFIQAIEENTRAVKSLNMAIVELIEEMCKTDIPEDQPEQTLHYLDGSVNS